MLHIDTMGNISDIGWQGLKGALLSLMGKEIFGFQVHHSKGKCSSHDLWSKEKTHGACRLGSCLYTPARSDPDVHVHPLGVSLGTTTLSLSPESRVQLGGAREEVPHVLQIPLLMSVSYYEDDGDLTRVNSTRR